MKTIQNLFQELIDIYPKLTIRMEASYQLDAGNEWTPHLIVYFGKDWENHFDVGLINKTTGEFKLESELNIESNLDEYYEFFEGGYEDDLEDCLKRMIENIKKFKH